MNNTTENKCKKEKRKMILIMIPVVIIFFLLGVLTGLLLFGKRSCNSRGGVDYRTDQSGTAYKEDVDTAEKGVTIPGIPDLHIPAGEKTVYAQLVNPQQNSGEYYLSYDMEVDIDGKYETLYSSDLLEPGKTIEKITLSHSLKKGKYRAVMHIQPYRMDGALTPTNNADIVFYIYADQVF